ncbi:SCY1-like protein 2 [Rhodnius prolixus]|uniref:Protein kinase domain-containing protein n=1 Tax=Rhodnius neglectus TaxID=72488 RepID=A0A0N7Z9M3_9HEMI
MEVLNRFCNTVSSTVSQLQGVLPGNPVTREYEVTRHIASAGPGLLWKIYSGYKKSTKQNASIFVFEKRQVVPQDRDILIETLKRGIAQLTKLRHPQILVVQHPLEESRDCLAFATEPVFSSLANILGNKENLPPNCDVNGYQLFDVEIKYGLMQIGEGLVFLHKDAKIVHHNLCPSSIIINEQGAWKIFGFDFAIQNSSSDAMPTWRCSEEDCGSSYPHALAHPHPDYLAPECFSKDKKTLGPPSDNYSLGVLIYALYNEGRSPFNGDRKLARLKNSELSLSKVVDGLRQLVKMMLHPSPELRPDEHEFLKADFFEDVGVKALNYLDSLFQWDNKQKSHFYKGLPQILGQLPHRVCLLRVVPCLTREFVNPMMVPFVLPSMFVIAEKCNKQEFISHILPQLKTVITIQEPVQVLLIFMQRMELMLKMTPCEDVKSDVLPLLYRALESDSQDIQELCLSVLPTFAELIEYPAMKNALLPRIKRLCISTSFVSVRVNCLVCIGKLLDYLDKWLVMDEVLPFLPQIPSKEPAVLMGILGIYKLVLNHKKMSMSKEIMAQKVIPFLMPLCVENFLTLNQFNALISVVKEMVSKVEQEHRVKLEQLYEEQQTLDNSLPQAKINAPPTQPSVNSLNDLLALEKSTPMTATTEIKSSSHQVKQLSFEDKQRLITEEDASRQMMTGPQTLTPSLAPIGKHSTTVKDLTANLLESNNFSINTGASQSCNNPSVHNSIDGIMGNIGIKSGMVGTAPYSYVRGRTIIGGVDKTIGNPSVCKSVRSNFSTSDTLNSIGNAFQGNWTSWQSSSVFQPASNITPIIQNNTVTKQLSKDEINDLLS